MQIFDEESNDKDPVPDKYSSDDDIGPKPLKDTVESNEVSSDDELSKIQKKFEFPISFGKINTARKKKANSEIFDASPAVPIDPAVLRSFILKTVSFPEKDNKNITNHKHNEESDQPQEKSSDLFIPSSSSIEFMAHEKSVTALALNTKASRLASGGHDSEIRLWDFGGMTSDPNSFRRLLPAAGHGIRAISFSPTGSHFVCAAGDAVARIYDIDGNKLQETVRGDMYVRDLAQTKGHTHAINDCDWHPFDKEKFLTASADATIRIFDITSKPYGVDQALAHISVLKAVDKRNLNIAGQCRVTAACWSPSDAKFIIGGCSDGSLQLWNERRIYGKPDKVVRDAHKNDSEITSIKIFKDGFRFISRSTDETMKFWDIRKFKTPIYSWNNLPNDIPGLDVCLSPNERLVLTGTSSETSQASIEIFDTETFALMNTLNISRPEKGPLAVVSLSWPEPLNQIIVGGSDGRLRIFYDLEYSKKGALLFLNRPAVSRQQTLEGFQAPIFTPDDLPIGFKQTRTGEIKRVRPQDQEGYSTKVMKTVVPTQPSQKATGLATTVMGHLSISSTKDQDPVEALRAYASKTDADPVFVTQAYKKTQPKPTLDYSMEEGDAEKMIRGMNKCPQCGLKLCRCGHMRALGIRPPDGSKFRRLG